VKERGLEPGAFLSGYGPVSAEGGAESGAVNGNNGPDDSDLGSVIEAWCSLSPDIPTAILTIAAAAAPSVPCLLTLAAEAWDRCQKSGETMQVRLPSGRMLLALTALESIERNLRTARARKLFKWRRRPDMQLVPVFEVQGACDVAQTETNRAVVIESEYVMRCSPTATTKASRIMNKCTAIVAVIGILLAGDGTARADKGDKHETVASLITTVVEEKDERLRKQAVEKLVNRDNASTPLIIDALRKTNSHPAKEEFVYVLSQKKDERTKKVLFEVLKNTKFSPKAKKWAVYGLSELTRVVNRSSVEQLKRIYKLQKSELVKTKLRGLLTGLEPFPLKDNLFAKDPSSAEMHQGLQGWARIHPDIMDIAIRGHSVLGKPILLVTITDEKTSDDNKSIVLFTSTHCGGEEIGATSLLHLTKWLLGKGEVATRIRKQIIVLIIPCVNPDGWDARRRSGRPYHSRRGKTNTAWNVYGINIYDTAYWFGPAAAEENPEGLAILKVAEEYHPDASMDIHSTQRGMTMPESTGFSWGDFNAHSFQPLIVEEMNRAVEEAGCLAERPAMDAGRIKIGSRIRGREHNYYRIRDKQTIMSHLYLRYHTLAYNCEAAYDFAVVARARRLLEIGTETWRNEFYPGYPSRQVGRWGSTSIAAWGDTAKKRRKSRVELWRKMNQIHFGAVTNHRSPRLRDNKIMSICATTAHASEKWIGYGTKEDILTKLAKHKKINYEYIAEFVRGLRMAVTTPPHYSLGYKSGDVSDAPVRNGLAMRVFIPYSGAEIYDARIDGYQVGRSQVDGYMVRRGPGTIVQFNIPPQNVSGVHLVSLKYKVARLHRQGFDQESDWDVKAN